MTKKKVKTPPLAKIEKKVETQINTSNKILDNFELKIQKSQLIYQLAQIDWATLIVDNSHFKGISMHHFVPEIVKDLKTHFISKLEEIFNQNKPVEKTLNNEDYAILKLLTNQVKAKNPVKSPEVEVNEVEPEVVPEDVAEVEAPKVKTTSMAELKKMTPQERAAVVKAEMIQKNAPKENRMTIVNNPHRKAQPTPFESQARALGEGSVIMNGAYNGLLPTINAQFAPSVPVDNTVSDFDPNAI